MSKVSNLLPEGWILSTLGQEFKWSSGGTPKSNVASYYDGDIPWMVIGDLNDSIVVETARSITEQGLRNSSAKWVREGSILLAMYGASIGKLGIAGKDITTNQAVAFTYADAANPRYLFWFLRSIRSNLSALGKGGAQPNISQTVIKAVPFPVAPREEQDQIVEAIETQFTRLDDAVAALKRARARLKRYRASVLKSACEGRLVPTEAELAHQEGRSYEPASVLLERIAAEREAAPGKKRGKAKSAAPLDTSQLSELPEGWIWSRLREVSDIQGGIQKQPKRTPRDNAYPFLRVANVLRGKLDLAEMHLIELFGEELDKLRLETGDLLIVEGNGSPDQIGRMALWNGSIDDCVHQNHIIRARVRPSISPQFIQCFWNSPVGKESVLKVAASTSGLYTLSVSKVSRIAIPIPPLAEQKRIVEEVERRLTIIEQTEATVETNLRRAQSLRQSILRLAFRGHLIDLKGGFA